MEEIWKDIPGFEGYYQVSNLGRVKSLGRYVSHYKKKDKVYRKEKILNQSKNAKGYYKVTFTIENKIYYYRVHQLVAMAFLNHKPDGLNIVVDHIDNERRFDNSVSNLQLLSNAENIRKDFKKTFRKRCTSTGRFIK